MRNKNINYSRCPECDVLCRTGREFIQTLMPKDDDLNYTYVRRFEYWCQDCGHRWGLTPAEAQVDYEKLLSEAQNVL